MFRDPDREHLTELAADLRRGEGAELIDELELAEAETELGRRRRRRLTDQWEATMHRGDSISVWTTFGRVAGLVDFVGADYATVIRHDLCWDLRLDRGAVTVHRASHGGHRVTGGSRTFRARLAEYEATGEIVELVLPALNLELRGRVAVAAVDHVVVEGSDGATTVPTGLIDAIRRTL